MYCTLKSYSIPDKNYPWIQDPRTPKPPSGYVTLSSDLSTLENHVTWHSVCLTLVPTLKIVRYPSVLHPQYIIRLSFVSLIDPNL